MAQTANPNALLTPEVQEQSILIVEDNRFMLTLLSELIRDMGMTRVSTANDGREAVEMFQAVVPTFVLTDWHMPGMSGLEFTKWVRQSPDSPNPRAHIIMITGANQANDIIEARDAGISEFIVKPITPQAIAQRLLINMSKPRDFVRSPGYTGPDRRRKALEGYSGSLRRLNDPVEQGPKGEELKVVRQILNAELKTMLELTRDIDVADRRQLKRLRNSVHQARATAKSTKDREFSGIAGSLTGYIDAMGASGNLDREVVLMHMSAMGRLMNMAHDDPQRMATVSGLEKVVAKRLRQAGQTG